MEEKSDGKRPDVLLVENIIEEEKICFFGLLKKRFPEYDFEIDEETKQRFTESVQRMEARFVLEKMRNEKLSVEYFKFYKTEYDDEDNTKNNMVTFLDIDGEKLSQEKIKENNANSEE